MRKRGLSRISYFHQDFANRIFATVLWKNEAMTALTDEVNATAVQAWMKERPRPKTEAFDQLVQELNGDVLMAEMMWIYWGKGALTGC